MQWINEKMNHIHDTASFAITLCENIQSKHTCGCMSVNIAEYMQAFLIKKNFFLNARCVQFQK